MSDNDKYYIEYEGNTYEFFEQGYSCERAREVWVLKNNEWFDINAPDNYPIYELYYVKLAMTE